MLSFFYSRRSVSETVECKVEASPEALSVVADAARSIVKLACVLYAPKVGLSRQTVVSAISAAEDRSPRDAGTES